MFSKSEANKLQGNVKQYETLSLARDVVAHPLPYGRVLICSEEGSGVFNTGKFDIETELSLRIGDPIFGLSDGRIVCGRMPATQGPLEPNPNVVHMARHNKFTRLNSNEFISTDTYLNRAYIYRCDYSFILPYASLTLKSNKKEPEVLFLGDKTYAVAYSDGHIDFYQRDDKLFTAIGKTQLTASPFATRIASADSTYKFCVEHVGGAYVLIREYIHTPSASIKDFYGAANLAKLERTQVTMIRPLSPEFKLVGHYFYTPTCLRFVTADYRKNRECLYVWDAETGIRRASYPIKSSVRYETNLKSPLQHVLLDNGIIVDYSDFTSVKFLKYSEGEFFIPERAPKQVFNLKVYEKQRSQEQMTFSLEDYLKNGNQCPSVSADLSARAESPNFAEPETEEPELETTTSDTSDEENAALDIDRSTEKTQSPIFDLEDAEKQQPPTFSLKTYFRKANNYVTVSASTSTQNQHPHLRLESEVGANLKALGIFAWRCCEKNSIPVQPNDQSNTSLRENDPARTMSLG